MTTKLKCLRATCLVLFLVAGTPADAFAQRTRSVSISDGEVYVDGRRLAEHELPPELETGDMHLQYTFSGDENPVIRIGRHFFVLDDDRLRVADEGAYDVMPPAFDARPNVGSPNVRVEFRTDDDITRFAAPHSVVLQRKARELQEQAVRLERLQSDMRSGNAFPEMREIQEAARQVRVHAGEAARMAAAMPQMQVQAYLNEVQRRNRGLFDRLVTEREMERETHRLARRIRSMEESAERTAHMQELRARLGEIFELKQQNRRQEVVQLEERLQELQLKLQEREQRRQEIVERRLQQLLGSDAEW